MCTGYFAEEDRTDDDSGNCSGRYAEESSGDEYCDCMEISDDETRRPVVNCHETGGGVTDDGLPGSGVAPRAESKSKGDLSEFEIQLNRVKKIEQGLEALTACVAEGRNALEARMDKLIESLGGFVYLDGSFCPAGCVSPEKVAKLGSLVCTSSGNRATSVDVGTQTVCSTETMTESEYDHLQLCGAVKRAQDLVDLSTDCQVDQVTLRSDVCGSLDGVEQVVGAVMAIKDTEAARNDGGVLKVITQLHCYEGDESIQPVVPPGTLIGIPVIEEQWVETHGSINRDRNRKHWRIKRKGRPRCKEKK